jgi:hypothetical protein
MVCMLFLVSIFKMFYEEGQSDRVVTEKSQLCARQGLQILAHAAPCPVGTGDERVEPEL